MPFNLLIFVLIFAPIAYGTTGPIAMMIVQAVVLFGLLWVTIEALRGRRKFYRPPGLLPLGLLGGFMALQAIPVPPGLLEIISPVTFQRYAETVWLLQPDVWMPLSVNVERSVSALSYYLTCVGFYLFATQCLADGKRLKKVVRIVTTFVGIYALLAILESLMPNGHVLWILRPWPEYTSGPFGANLNGNHFANLMAMMLPLAFMLFLVDLPSKQYGNWKERLVDFCSDPRLGTHLVAGFSALFAATAIFLSISRGGILSTFGAMLVLCLLLVWRKQYRRQALILVGFIILLFFFVGIFGWDAIFEHFAKIRNLKGEIFDGRLSYWQDSLALFRDFPFFGTGFGSFVDSYAGYQTIYQGELTVANAHNDYFELSAEAGLVGLCLALWAAVKVLRDSWKAFDLRRTRFAQSLYLGALAGICALLLHCVTEFNLHVGANGLYFTFLAALLVALSSTSSRSSNSSELLRVSNRNVKFVMSFASVVLLASLVFNISGLVAEAKVSPYEKLSLSGLDQAELDVMLKSTREAIAWAPLTSSHRYMEIRILTVSGANAEAILAYGDLLQLRPLYAFYLQRAAVTASFLGRDDLAGTLLKSGVELDRVDLRRIKPYVEWLLKQQRSEQAFVQIKRGLELAPNKTRDFINLMLINGVPSIDMVESLPERAHAWQLYANYLIEVKQDRFAERAYRKAMHLSASEERPSHSAHWAYYKYLETNQRYDEAIAVMLQAIELFPDNANLHGAAGVLYERQQIPYRAKEEYRQALLLNPKLDWVRKRLDRL